MLLAVLTQHVFTTACALSITNDSSPLVAECLDQVCEELMMVPNDFGYTGRLNTGKLDFSIGRIGRISNRHSF